MDIKKFYDAIKAAKWRGQRGIDWEDTTHFEDIAFDVLIADQDYIADCILDALVEMDKDRFKSLVSSSSESIQYTEDPRSRRSARLSANGVVAVQYGLIGSHVVTSLCEYIEDDIERNLDSWIEDARNYESDMWSGIHDDDRSDEYREKRRGS